MTLKIQQPIEIFIYPPYIQRYAYTHTFGTIINFGNAQEFNKRTVCIRINHSEACTSCVQKLSRLYTCVYNTAKRKWEREEMEKQYRSHDTSKLLLIPFLSYTTGYSYIYNIVLRKSKRDAAQSG